jgi:hypothetical protein
MSQGRVREDANNNDDVIPAFRCIRSLKECQYQEILPIATKKIKW